MNIRKHILTPIALVVGVAAAAPFAAQAMGAERCDGRFGRHGMMHGDGEMGHFDGAAPMPPFIRDLKLTEAQRDQVFKIMHDQAPLLREKAKEAHKAHTELRALTFSANYDEAKVRALTESGAQAMAAMAQLRASGANQIYQLLTPEQRKKADELKAEFENHGPRRAAPPQANDDQRPGAKRR